MAIRQYIGARYVPRFTGLHDITQSYEALDVVDNGSGTSYIAKKPTPAGTPLTDTDYWFIYGSTNGAIINLQNQIDDMKDGTVPGSLQNQIDKITDLIWTHLADLKNKTIAIFGASNELAANTEGVNWTDVLASYLTGIATVINKSVNARRITQAIDDYIADPDHATYDIVIFCCTRNAFGAQDYSDLPTQTGDVGNIIKKIDSLAPYKTLDQKFYFASCSAYSNPFQTYPMCLYDGVVKRAAEKNGYYMLDMHSWLGVSDANSAQFTHDGVHMKASVAPIYAEKCLKALIKGTEPFTNYQCKLVDSAVYNYLSSGLASGIILDPNVNPGETRIVADVDLNFKIVAYLKNTSGAILPANSAIYSTSASGNELMRTPRGTRQKTISAWGTPIEVENRITGIFNLNDIADNGTCVIQWGYPSTLNSI